MMEFVIGRFVLYLGIFLVAAGSLELFFGRRASSFWEKWIENRFFPLHGLLLIAGGLPLTAYNGTFSTFIFAVGLTVVFTGPFILLYPDKIRSSFREVSHDEGQNFKQRLVRFDGILRILCGLIFIASRFL